VIIACPGGCDPGETVGVVVDSQLDAGVWMIGGRRAVDRSVSGHQRSERTTWLFLGSRVSVIVKAASCSSKGENELSKVGAPKDARILTAALNGKGKYWTGLG
jgi:hypothetical protein